MTERNTIALDRIDSLKLIAHVRRKIGAYKEESDMEVTRKELDSKVCTCTYLSDNESNDRISVSVFYAWEEPS